MNVFEPKPEMICIEDIAHGLSNMCRFGGHVKHFYSVAQHSVMCHDMVDQEYKLQALLHDASEAYCKDIPKPLKELLPDYREIEARVDGAIRARFNLPLRMSEDVHRADLILLATERRDLMRADSTPWAILAGVEALPRKIVAVQPSRAQAMFIKRYVELTMESRRAA